MDVDAGEELYHWLQERTFVIMGRVLPKENLVSEAALKEVSHVIVVRPPGTNKLKHTGKHRNASFYICTRLTSLG